MQTGDSASSQKASQTYPFRSVGQALYFAKFNNPARAKSFNLIEPTRVHTSSFTERTGLSPADVYAAVVISIAAAFDRVGRDKATAFERAEAARDTTTSMEEIARALHVCERTLYRILREVRDTIRDELEDRRLLEPEKD